VVFIVSLVLVAATLVYGAEVKGARRWLVIAGLNIQPSEFLKPAFVILIAWLFGESARRPEMPANTIALGMLGVSVAALVLQPDFVFAVAAEEFGIVLCLMLLALFAFIVLRGLRHALRNEEAFARFAAAGLAILFGLQSAINMAVNVHLMPAKGMTLPFLSYG